MSCEKKFARDLRAQGLRLTPQREIILGVLHEIEGLATAEQIYARVMEVTSSTDISTVYRTLDLLQEFHLVASIDTPDGDRRYELLGLHGPHLHLVCRKCGRVIGMPLDAFRPFLAHVEEVHGFAVDLEHLSIPGLCAACQEKD